jgi:hypothetical protein
MCATAFAMINSKQQYVYKNVYAEHFTQLRPVWLSVHFTPVVLNPYVRQNQDIVNEINHRIQCVTAISHSRREQ